MSTEGLRLAQQKMRDAGVVSEAIDVFSHYYGELESGATGLIPEETIEPLLDPPSLTETTVAPDQMREAFGRTAIIKLNGGLGTSMGMDRAKSLLPVRAGRRFLDLIVDQVRSARSEHEVPLPLILMDSFRTQADTLAALARHDGIAVEGLPLDFVQNLEPKLRADDHLAHQPSYAAEQIEDHHQQGGARHPLDSGVLRSRACLCGVFCICC